MVAFELSARYLSFSRAASELNTSPSAISRHIAQLEDKLGVLLFERTGRKVILTQEGEYFYRSVSSGLETIRSAITNLTEFNLGDKLTIACTHEISHLLLMPRFNALQTFIGEGCKVRILTFEYDSLGMTIDPSIDVILTYDSATSDNSDRVVVLPESIKPVCSVQFAKLYADTLERAPAHWGNLNFLKLTRRNRGWATWEDWLASKDAVNLAPKYFGFDNYIYLLEAAVNGQGLAPGWKGLVDRYLSDGSLVCAAEYSFESSHALLAVLTDRGRDRLQARRCLSFLSAIQEGLKTN
jgi:LysR family transcriptional regulator, glycine cleavage system transcriptional activator